MPLLRRPDLRSLPASAILTGSASIWRLEEAGNLWSTLPKKFITYPEVLAESGYSVEFYRESMGPDVSLPVGVRNPQVWNFRKES